MLGLGLPTWSDVWIRAFADGFYSLVDRYQCPLIGGDTTRSQRDIVLSVTVFGEVDDALALKRNAATVDDDIWISGELGAADLACRMLSGELALQADWLAATRGALEQPIPRLDLGLALLGHAHSAIDVSDGLLQDLGHILTQSQVGAVIEETLLPMHAVIQKLPIETRRQTTLGGGDLYELCFTAAVSKRMAIEHIGRTLNVRLTRIGQIVERSGLTVLDAARNEIKALPDSYDHFKEPA